MSAKPKSSEGAHGPVPKSVVFGPGGLRDIARGVHLLAAAMRRCYGPASSRTIVGRLFDSPLLVSDAAQIAKDFDHRARVPNIGARLLREALDDVQRSAGDGGIATAILLDEMLRDGVRQVTAGIDPQGLRRGIERASEAAMLALRSAAGRMNDDFAVASLLATNGCEVDLARLIRQAVGWVGVTGTIRVVESTKATSELVLQDGLFYERGLLSNVFATHPAKVESCLHDPYIFLTDRTLVSRDDVLGILETAHAQGGDLLIVATGVEGDALSTLISNHVGNVMRIAAIRAPEYGEQRDEVLQDIAASTGALVHRHALHGNVPCEQFGRASRVVVTTGSTQIVGPHRDALQCALRLTQAELQVGSALSQFDRERVQRRIGNLQGRTAELRIGGTTDVEMGERQERCINMLCAIRLGLRHGVAAAAGCAYVKAAATLASIPAASAAEQAGVNIVRRALEGPARQLLRNAHVDDLLTEEIICRYRQAGTTAVYDIYRGVWRHAFVDGLIDPLPAVTEPLRVAASIAGLLLNTGVVVSDDMLVD